MSLRNFASRTFNTQFSSWFIYLRKLNEIKPMEYLRLSKILLGNLWEFLNCQIGIHKSGDLIKEVISFRFPFDWLLWFMPIWSLLLSHSMENTIASVISILWIPFDLHSWLPKTTNFQSSFILNHLSVGLARVLFRGWDIRKISGKYRPLEAAQYITAASRSKGF